LAPNADDCKARDAPKVLIPLAGKVPLGDEAKGGSLDEELKDLGGRKSRVMVDRCAKFATENLSRAAARIERSVSGNVVDFRTFSPQLGKRRVSSSS